LSIIFLRSLITISFGIGVIVMSFRIGDRDLVGALPRGCLSINIWYPGIYVHILICVADYVWLIIKIKMCLLIINIHNRMHNRKVNEISYR
jgi:ABC-type uncharacterized transport system permease subunit